MSSFPPETSATVNACEMTLLPSVNCRPDRFSFSDAVTFPLNEFIFEIKSATVSVEVTVTVPEVPALSGNTNRTCRYPQTII